MAKIECSHEFTDYAKAQADIYGSAIEPCMLCGKYSKLIKESK